MSTKIFFDLDGTLFNLYGQSNWLEKIQNEDSTVFNGEMLPEIDKIELFKVVSKLLARGVQFEVITWLPMGASPEFEAACEQVKRKWVEKNLPFISKITCQSYGIPKQNAISKRATRMFLIDDNTEVCEMWETSQKRIAINVTENFTVVNALKRILKIF